MSTKIYLIRHAEAEGNLFRLAHGQYDSTITPRGYRQLAYLRERFRPVSIDAVYGSDLTRAHTTASAVYVPKHLPFQPMKELRELRLGDWEQMSWGEILRADPDMYADFNKRPHLWRVANAETFAEARDRMVNAIRWIAAQNPDRAIAVVSHGAALRTLLGTLQGLTLEEIGHTGHADNTAVSLLEVNGEQINLIFRDDASHLPADVSTFRRQSWHKEDAATEPGLWFHTCREDSASREVDAMMDNNIAGRIAFAAEDGGLRITDYQLVPGLRGQGYGVQMLGQAVQFARKHGIESVVLACGKKLAGYFAQFGFEQLGESGDNVEMRLDIRLIIREIPEI